MHLVLQHLGVFVYIFSRSLMIIISIVRQGEVNCEFGRNDDHPKTANKLVIRSWRRDILELGFTIDLLNDLQSGSTRHD